MTETVWTCPTCQRRLTLLVKAQGVWHACKGQKLSERPTGALTAFVPNRGDQK